MSLIEEALRKQARDGQPPARRRPDDGDRDRLGDGGPPRDRPPEGVVAPFARPGAEERRALSGPVAAAAILLLLLGAGGGLLWLRARQSPAGRPADAAALPVPPAPRAVAPAVVAAAAAATAAVAVASASPVPPPPAALAPSVAPAATAAPPAAIAAPAMTSAPPAAVATPEPPPPVWPEVVIKGMFSVGGRTNVVLGDGSVLDVGAFATNGVQLLATAADAVRLEYRGSVRIYRRGGGVFLPTASAPAGPQVPAPLTPGGRVVESNRP